MANGFVSSYKELEDYSNEFEEEEILDEYIDKRDEKLDELYALNDKIADIVEEKNCPEWEEYLDLYKIKMDAFFDEYPREFFRYMDQASHYYATLAMLQIKDKKILEARLSHARFFIYECLSPLQILTEDCTQKFGLYESLSKNKRIFAASNDSKVKEYLDSLTSQELKLKNDFILHDSQLDQLINCESEIFDSLLNTGKEKSNPFKECKFKNLASILISYLLFLSEIEILSHGDYWILTYWIKKLIENGEKCEEFYIKKKIRRILKFLVIDKRDRKIMTLSEWQRVVPDLEKLLNFLSGTTSIEELAQEISDRYK